MAGGFSACLMQQLKHLLILVFVPYIKQCVTIVIGKVGVSTVGEQKF